MSQRTPTADAAIRLCQRWARNLERKTGVKSYLFGSTIYQDGIQFDPVSSDLDIACVIPSEIKSATDRFSLMKAILIEKRDLELSMIPALGRNVCHEPGVSIIPLTQIELMGDVHKSGVSNFFRSNSFMDLRSGDEEFGMADAGSISLEPTAFQAMAYSQKIRNEYLSVAANGAGGLKPFDGQDPLPKPLLRSAAQISKDPVRGQHYDVRFGLEEMHRILLARRLDSPAISKLFDSKVSVRRGGRGAPVSLDADDQLLLAEILFDSSTTVPHSTLVTWDLRVHNTPYSSTSVESIFSKVKAISTGAQLIGNWAGSIVLRIVSSKASFELFELLSQSNILGKALGVDKAEVISINRERPSSAPIEYQDERLAGVLQAIRNWTPGARFEVEVEIELRDVIGRAITEHNLHADGYSVQTNPRISITPMKAARFDILVLWFAGANRPELSVPIELKRFNGTGTVSQLLERLHDSSMTTILVVYDIPPSQMADVQSQANRSAEINANLIFLLKSSS